MARTIEISVRDRIAWQTNKREYIWGNGGFVVVFKFDKEWENIETKTARFIYGEHYTDVAFVGDSCAVPAVNGVGSMMVGVYADDLQTTCATVRCKRSILCEQGKPDTVPPGTHKRINLVDRATNKEYTLYIENGNLKMEEA
jgi:hypothetical protein